MLVEVQVDSRGKRITRAMLRMKYYSQGVHVKVV